MHEHGVIKDFESQVYRKDASIIWISENARVVRDEKGRVQYYEGTVEDFTARKEAEEKLRLSESRFRSVWQNSSDGMRLTDELGIILAVNPSFCHMVGIPEEELVGRPFTVIYADLENLADMMQQYQKSLAARNFGGGFERQFAFRSGRKVDVELSNSFIELEEGRCLILSIFRDVTVRKQAEERERLVNAELARSQAELRKKNEILEEDLKMASEIQQAILPQQYPAFPPGATAESSLLHFCHRYRPTGQALRPQGGIVHLRRDGAWRPLRAGHSHGARAGGGIAPRGHGPRPHVDSD
jgi:PAS domain S-box-containing protein